MRLTLALLLNSLLILSVPTPLLAKGKTVKITIKGADLKAPIEISDSRILENFQVWTGPGTSTDEGPSFIIDWPQGPVTKPPQSLRRYQVSFHTAPNEQIVYVVYYAFSPGVEQGYVYLPGESDEWAGLNVRSIWRGVEGKWFRAWSAWERAARPLIEKVALTDSIHPDNWQGWGNPLLTSYFSVLGGFGAPCCEGQLLISRTRPLVQPQLSGYRFGWKICCSPACSKT